MPWNEFFDAYYDDYLTAKALQKELDIEKYCFYSDEDDNNKEKFERFIKDTNAKEIYLKGYNHFDGYHNINEIPELNSLLEKFI